MAGVGEVVDGDELEVRPGRLRGAEDVAPDASETVDADLHSHEVNPSWIRCGGADASDVGARQSVPIVISISYPSGSLRNAE